MKIYSVVIELLHVGLRTRRQKWGINMHNSTSWNRAKNESERVMASEKL